MRKLYLLRDKIEEEQVWKKQRHKIDKMERVFTNYNFIYQ